MDGTKFDIFHLTWWWWWWWCMVAHCHWTSLHFCAL